MRIAFVLGAFPALSETFVINQITGLIDRGHDVDIYAVHPRREEHVHQVVKEYDLTSRVRYDYVASSPARRLLKAVELLARSSPEQLRVRLKSLDAVSFGNYASRLRLICATAAFDRKQNYDIIYCHFGPNGVKGSFLRKIGALSGKLVVVLHGTDVMVVPDQMDRRCYEEALAGADLLMPISPRWNHLLLNMGCDARKIITHSMGIDCQKYQPLPERKQSTDINIISVARLVEKKGLELGIRAFARLHREKPNVRYTIVGDGPLLGELKNVARQEKVEQFVTFKGALPENELIPLLQSSQFMLCPSLKAADGDIEGVPVAIMEALACELAVVATDHSGIGELIEHGVTGMLSNERDLDDIYGCLRSIADDPESANRLGRNGREGVCRKHDINLLNNRLAEILTALCHAPDTVQQAFATQGTLV